MQVILKEDVDHLGYAGDVVDVKKGYWRNYLRPRSLAETATAARIADLTQRMERRRAAEARNDEEAAELASLLNRTVLTIPAQAGPQGKLFGSVTAGDIARAVEGARKLRLDPKKVRLEEPIKSIGTYMVPIDVFPGVRAEVKTMVVEAKTSDEEIARLTAEAEARETAERDQAEAAAAAEAEAAQPAEPTEPAEETDESQAEVTG